MYLIWPCEFYHKIIKDVSEYSLEFHKKIFFNVKFMQSDFRWLKFKKFMCILFSHGIYVRHNWLCTYCTTVIVYNILLTTLESSPPYIIRPDCLMLRWRPLDPGDSLPCRLEGCELCTEAQLKSSVVGAIYQQTDFTLIPTLL